MLIIARVGLKSCGSQSSFTSAKASVNNPFYPGQQPIRDVESVSREDDIMVVHIRQATEIRLDDMKLVSAARIVSLILVLTFVVSTTAAKNYPLRGGAPPARPPS